MAEHVRYTTINPLTVLKSPVTSEEPLVSRELALFLRGLLRDPELSSFFRVLLRELSSFHLHGLPMEPGDHDDVFLHLAESLTAESFDSSDEEPLKRKIGFTESDDELLKWHAGFNTSDDEPLLVKSRAGKDGDDPVGDPSYVPSSDSEQGKQQKKTRKRRKRMKTADKELHEVQQRSLAEHMEQQANLQEHVARLDNFLSANGLERQEIAPDGNCFFAASAAHLEGINHEELRSYLCDHLQENFTDYINFIEAEDENERYCRFFWNVQQLRKPGTWSNDVANLLPRVLSDWAKKTVVIYFSDRYKSELEIHPSSGTLDRSVIPLAFINYEPPHYDACLPLPRTRPPLTDQLTSPSDEAGSSANYTCCNTSFHIDASAVQVNEDNDETLPDDGVNAKFQSFVANTAPLHDAGDSCSSPNDAGCPTTTARDVCSASPYCADNDTPCCDSVTEQSTLDTSSQPASSSKADVSVTPRKQGSFSTPPKKGLTRHREARPETWKKNVRKSLHLQGKEYVSQSGKTVQAKRLKAVDCSKCRYKCSENITADKRQEIFDSFYALGTYERQKDFVCANITQKKTKTMFDEESRKPAGKKRQVCRVFSFQVDGTVHRVCKNFFLGTLAIGETYVNHAMRNSSDGVFKGKQRRGKARPPHNRYSDAAVQQAKDHIASFPVVESHYTRKDTQRLYLSSELTLRKMYDLYVERCKDDSHPPVSQRKYREIFNENFNYSFHHPKKDQCATCTLFKQKGNTATHEETAEFEQHIERKNRAREEKDKDKKEAASDPSKHVVTMDLQAVLPTPCGLVSQLYYKRKLSVYNFTIYSLTDKKGTCYLWDETQGKRGSCEIATCVYIHLKRLPETVEEVTIFSDCCGGQNRNQYLSAALIHAVNNISNIRIITHKYLEPGHTHMECDSMHAAITFAKRHTPIFTPSSWDIVLRMARRGQPYVIYPIHYTDILDFKGLASAAVRNTKTDLKGNRVSWRNIKAMQFVKGQEEMMCFKYSFDDEDFEALKMIGSSKRRTAPLPSSIPRRYSCKLSISMPKKQDLLSLCASGIIPAEHHSFYQELPTSSSVTDKLPEPDAMEEEPEYDSD